MPLLELLFPFLIGAGVGSAHPPKSSSAATAGAGLVAGEGAPQPLPMSFAVKVSGTFIADVAFEAAAGGDGSAMLHAFPPQGSRVLAENAFEGLTVLVGGDLTVACCGGKERLKTEVWLGEATGGEVVIVSVAVGAVLACGTGEEKRSNISLDALGGAAGAFVDPTVDPIRSKVEGGGDVTWSGFGSGCAEISLKKLPPLDIAGEVIFGAAGEDLELVRLSKAAKVDCCL